MIFPEYDELVERTGSLAPSLVKVVRKAAGAYNVMLGNQCVGWLRRHKRLWLAYWRRPESDLQRFPWLTTTISYSYAATKEWATMLVCFAGYGLMAPKKNPETTT